ncbi:unnamed protein product [Cylindrotheca closterium]|uniref:Uncharacterized protein n=1 Tax=Cylindrotheca closterium TaxID=2856 RepID=A0AAD2FL12_9STRA|nr:unnamed protein product [Cylindrotheca closterium]
MALQLFMNDLMEESGAQSIVVVADDVTNHTIEKRVSLFRSLQLERQDNNSNGRISQDHGPACSSSPCQVRRDEGSTGSLQDMRVKRELLEDMKRLSWGEQRLLSHRSSPRTLKRMSCFYEPRNDA